MKRVSIADVESWISPASERRPLAKVLGAENVAINYFELEPGEQFGFGYHRHPDQEEVFYVLDGTATFETEDGDVTVSADEVIRFEPGEWQLGRNEGDERLRALALGAPPDSDTELTRECADCGGRQPTRIERADGEDALVTICETCGGETGRFS